MRVLERLGLLSVVVVTTTMGCATVVVDEVPYRVADRVVEAPGHTGRGFFDAERAVNGVRGGGLDVQGTDVFSLGYDPGVDDLVVVQWTGARVSDGPGVDLVVFENAFEIASAASTSGARFMDPAVVEVSADGTLWVALPHGYLAPDGESFSTDPDHWSGFAGVSPVLLHEEDNRVDPFDVDLAGGDGFDLATLDPRDPAADAVLRDGAAFVRIRSASSLTDPATGAPFPRHPAANGPDIDGVYGRYLIPR
jgi:hypothetical protein